MNYTFLISTHVHANCQMYINVKRTTARKSCNSNFYLCVSKHSSPRQGRRSFLISGFSTCLPCTQHTKHGMWTLGEPPMLFPGNPCPKWIEDNPGQQTNRERSMISIPLHRIVSGYNPSTISTLPSWTKSSKRIQWPTTNSHASTWYMCVHRAAILLRYYHK